MNPDRKTAIIVGILFITVLASSATSGAFLGSTSDADYLTAVSANENQVLIGVLLMLTLTASVVMIPLMMFPILKKQSESLALGYVGARAFEGLADAVIAFSQLLLLSLSREFVNTVTPDASYFQTSGALLLAVNDWSSILENFPYGLGALVFSYLMYKSRLIPRFISVWGLIGATLMLAVGMLRMFGHSWAIVLALPIIVNEMVLAVWLISKGFNSSATAS